MVRPDWDHANPDDGFEYSIPDSNIRGATYPEDPFGPLNLDKFQQAVGEWCLRNFGVQSDLVLYGGTAEEAGELLRAAVKREQGIRGTYDEWTAEIQKEMGDIAVKLASIAAQNGWSLANIIAERWADVSQREWANNEIGHGLPEEDR